MTKEEEFRKIAEQLDKVECPAFALWYLLPYFEESLKRQLTLGTCENKSVMTLAMMKYNELLKASKEIRDIVADELW